MQEVVAAYNDPGKDGVKQVQSSGLHVGGERFVVLKADERSIYGKKVRQSTLHDGITVDDISIERSMTADFYGVGS